MGELEAPAVGLAVSDEELPVGDPSRIEFTAPARPLPCRPRSLGLNRVP